MNDYISTNLKLQIALREQNLMTPMFPTYMSSKSVCIPAREVGCKYDCSNPVINGFFPESNYYCCQSATSTDLEIANYVNSTVAPYQERANLAARECCKIKR